MELLTIIILACQLNVASKYPADILKLQFKCQNKLIRCLKRKTRFHVFHSATSIQAESLAKCIGENVK